MDADFGDVELHAHPFPEAFQINHLLVRDTTGEEKRSPWAPHPHTGGSGDRLVRDWHAVDATLLGVGCWLTGIVDRALLRVSHIKRWSDCEREDVHWPAAVSSLWDAAFDRGLVPFNDDRFSQLSTHLSEAAAPELRWQASIRLRAKHFVRLEWHRSEASDKASAVPSTGN